MLYDVIGLQKAQVILPHSAAQHLRQSGDIGQR
jgi:hypothetical protein